MNRTIIKNYALIAVLATSVVVANRAQAQLIAYEGFDYSTGNSAVNLAGKGTNGPGWGTNLWTSQNAPFQAVVGGGTFNSPAGAALGSSGSHVDFADSDGNAALSERKLSIPTVNVGDSIFYSFQALNTDPSRANAGSNYSSMGLTLGGSTFAVDILPRNSINIPSTPFDNPGPVDMGLIEAAGNVSPRFNIPVSPANNPIFYVVEIKRVADVGLNTHFDFSVSSVLNPDLPITDVVNPLTTLMSFSNIFVPYTPAGLTSVNLQIAGVGFDEIRIGHTLADVSPAALPGPQPVPEPATLTALALGAFGVLKRRRKS
jgi:hypothetical protein